MAELLKIYICGMMAITLFACGAGCAQHGKPRPDNSAWLALTSAAIIAPVFYAAFRYAFGI